MPPQPWCCRKSTGDVTPALQGKRRRKSSSTGFTSFLSVRTWRGERSVTAAPAHAGAARGATEHQQHRSERTT